MCLQVFKVLIVSSSMKILKQGGHKVRACQGNHHTGICFLFSSPDVCKEHIFFVDFVSLELDEQVQGSGVLTIDQFAWTGVRSAPAEASNAVTVSIKLEVQLTFFLY